MTRIFDISPRQVRGRDTSDTPRKGSLLTLPVTPSVRRAYEHRPGIRALDIQREERIRLVLEFIRAKGRASNPEIIAATGAGNSTVIEYLKILKQRGQIRQSAREWRTVYYSAVGDNEYA